MTQADKFRANLVFLATSLRESYGGTLVEGSTDLQMAYDLLKNLRKHLPLTFNSLIAGKKEMDKTAFLKWRKKFLFDANMPEDSAEAQSLNDWDLIKGWR